MQTFEGLDFQGKTTLVRVDFNVPVDQNKRVSDDSRIQAHLPTLRKLREQNAKVVVMAHFGRPKGEPDSEFSLAPVAEYLRDQCQEKVRFLNNCIGEEVRQAIAETNQDTLILLENVRFHSGETEGDPKFAAELAANGDYYVNDAFGAAHRAHASTAIMAENFKGRKFPGLVMQAEIASVQKVLDQPQSPVVGIVGGAKVSSKIGVLENILPRLDALVIGGGMAFTFLRAQGGKTGNSLVEEEHISTANQLLAQAEKAGVSIHLPLDSKNAEEFKDQAPISVTDSMDIPEGQMGLDVGPETLASLQSLMAQAKTILWNGPLGVFEFEHYQEGTRKLAEFIAEATEKGAFSLVGGGDSVAAIKKFALQDRVSYVSTGGGAMLEFLEGKTLPGIAALQSED